MLDDICQRAIDITTARPDHLSSTAKTPTSISALPTSAQEKETLIEGGYSKDRRLEVRIVQDFNHDIPSDYVFAINNARTQGRENAQFWWPWRSAQL
jgi:hypothetical protein